MTHNICKLNASICLNEFGALEHVRCRTTAVKFRQLDLFYE